MASQRQARRERNREDFQRATQEGLIAAGHKTDLVLQAGVNAGNTFREHLEDEIRKAVRIYHRINNDTAIPPSKVHSARGIIRGLCKALLIYEDSYNKDDKHKLARIEKEFMDE
jgi:hypothetical protein